MELEPDKEVEGFLDALKAHFQRGKPPKSAAQLAAQRAQLMSSLPADASVDDSLLNIATGLQMVENISLLSHSKEQNYVGINMYVDDEASITGVKTNLRASEIAHFCGQPLNVKGDAFLARVLDDGDNFERMDLSLSEISSDADWVKAANRQASKRRSDGANSAEILRGLQESAPPSGGKSAAEVEKDNGNDAFRRGDWQVAIQHYTKAWQHDNSLLSAINNRSMAYLKLHEYEKALEDCRFVVKRDADNIKALLRRAVAYYNTGKVNDARQDVEKVLRLEQKNQQALNLLKKIEMNGSN